MGEHEKFNLGSLEELQAKLVSMGLSLPVDTDLSVLGESVPIGRHAMPNRFVVHPMEGFDADENGAPGELAFRRYRRYATGGAGLIWFEATAVVGEARSNAHQFWLHEGTVDTFARLVEETRRTSRETFGWEPVLVIQLTHSGRYSKPYGTPQPLIAHHSPILDPRGNIAPDSPVLTDDELDALQESFLTAARLAVQAGFDGIGVKCCHRYLVSELLASHTREGKYGGSYENRTRFVREVLGRIRDDLPETFITTRMNAYDAIEYPYGWGVSADDVTEPDLREPIQLARDLVDLGVPLLNVSVGNPYFNPHVGRPYDKPIEGFQPPAEHPLYGTVRFVEITRQMQEAVPSIPVVAGGYGWLRQFMPAVAAGVIRSGGAGLIGQGRGAFAYPDSPKDILEHGAMDPKKVCVTCSACTQIMRDGGRTGCVVRDAAVYGPEFKTAREQAKANGH